jgi:hypothetical protein
MIVLANPNLTTPLASQPPPKIVHTINRTCLPQETCSTHALSSQNPQAKVRNSNSKPGGPRQGSRPVRSLSKPAHPLRSLEPPNSPHRSSTAVHIKGEKGLESQRGPFKPVFEQENGCSAAYNIPQNKKHRARPAQARRRQEPQTAPGGSQVNQTTLLELLSCRQQESFTPPPQLMESSVYVRDITTSPEYPYEDVDVKCKVWSNFSFEDMLTKFQFLKKTVEVPEDLGM